MKFKRDDLIGRVKAAIEAERKRTAEVNAKAAEEYAAKRQAYVEETTPAWRELVKQLNLVLRSGRPVTPGDIPAALHAKGWTGTHLRVWTPEEPEPRKPATDQLEQILSILEACTDEEVTTNALERLGIKLAPIFRKHSI